MGAWSHKIDGNDTYCDVTYVFDDMTDKTPTVEDFFSRLDEIDSSWGRGEYRNEAAMYICYYAALNGLPIDDDLRLLGLKGISEELEEHAIESWTNPKERLCILIHFMDILKKYDKNGEAVDLIPTAGVLETILNNM